MVSRSARALYSSAHSARASRRSSALQPGSVATVRSIAAISSGAPVEKLYLVAESSKGSPEERGSETILLVLGEEPVRSVIRATLEEEGYAVLQAASGEEALGKAARHPGPIHLMLSDAAMPGMLRCGLVNGDTDVGKSL